MNPFYIIEKTNIYLIKPRLNFIRLRYSSAKRQEKRDKNFEQTTDVT